MNVKQMPTVSISFSYTKVQTKAAGPDTWIGLQSGRAKQAPGGGGGGGGALLHVMYDENTRCFHPLQRTMHSYGYQGMSIWQ